MLSALERPRNLFRYRAEPTVFTMAASLCSALIRNHPFVDGNKRVGLLAAQAFLTLNGERFRPDEAETVHVIVDLAAGDLDEAGLARWLASACGKRLS